MIFLSRYHFSVLLSFSLPFFRTARALVALLSLSGILLWALLTHTQLVPSFLSPSLNLEDLDDEEFQEMLLYRIDFLLRKQVGDSACGTAETAALTDQEILQKLKYPDCLPPLISFSFSFPFSFSFSCSCSSSSSPFFFYCWVFMFMCISETSLRKGFRRRGGRFWKSVSTSGWRSAASESPTPIPISRLDRNSDLYHARYITILSTPLLSVLMMKLSLQLRLFPQENPVWAAALLLLLSFVGFVVRFNIVIYLSFYSNALLFIDSRVFGVDIFK